MEESFPERLTSPQLVKKFPEFYGTRWFITAFTSARFNVSIPSQIIPAHVSLSYVLKMHFQVQSQNCKTPLFIFGMSGCPHGKTRLPVDGFS